MSVKDQIYKLELELLNLPTRQSEQRLNVLIADDFVEFGSSGKIYKKRDILKSLPTEKARSFQVYDFKATTLSENIILATYRVTENAVDSLRSSIWKYFKNGWQMIFHQGTLCEKPIENEG